MLRPVSSTVSPMGKNILPIRRNMVSLARGERDGRSQRLCRHSYPQVHSFVGTVRYHGTAEKSVFNSDGRMDGSDDARWNDMVGVHWLGTGWALGERESRCVHACQR